MPKEALWVKLPEVELLEEVQPNPCEIDPSCIIGGRNNPCHAILQTNKEAILCFGKQMNKNRKYCSLNDKGTLFNQLKSSRDPSLFADIIRSRGVPSDSFCIQGLSKVLPQVLASQGIHNVTVNIGSPGNISCFC